MTDSREAALDRLTDALYAVWDEGVPRAEIEAHIVFQLDNAEDITPQTQQ